MSTYLLPKVINSQMINIVDSTSQGGSKDFKAHEWRRIEGDKQTTRSSHWALFFPPVLFIMLYKVYKKVLFFVCGGFNPRKVPALLTELT